MNKVILMGRLTADPELRQTPSGMSSCRIRVAVQRRFADKTTGERQSDFFNCTAWGQTAEFVSRYFRKGNMIMIEGRLTTGSYQDKTHPDVTHYTTDITIENVEFTGSKSESQSGGSSYSAPANNFNNGYQAPPQQQAAPQQPAQNNDNMSYGSLGDFEEILSDGDVPF
ncbi:MAG: single-stranded DNA-binding protein [Ruminococcus sp.]|nr:single-stranded DNA-binding protein [Ruminococcus sp.]